MRSTHGLMDCDNEDKYVLQYAALEHDFDDLQEEAEEVAILLRRVNEKKQKLQAEIKFLKKRATDLRAGMGCHGACVVRQAPLGDVSENKICRPSRASARRTYSARGYHDQAVNPRSFNSHSCDMQRQKPMRTVLCGNREPFRNKNVVGASRSTILKPAPNGFASSKKKPGKRKITWDDDYSVKA